MDIKWKNKIVFVAFIMLITFGLSGMMSAISGGGEYLKKNYFQTQQFDDQLNQFIGYLSTLELNYRNSEEMKKEITVTAEEIQEHRYRYGDLAQQVEDIKRQYEDKINEAQTLNNKELVDSYIAERDKKIEDITNNFKSDEYVKAKVIKEKEQEIDKYYRELEANRPEFFALKTEFKYYLKDTKTGEVYTNLNVSNDVNVDELINNRNMFFICSFPTAKGGYLATERSLAAKEERKFDGKMGVPKSVSATGLIMVNYQDYRQKQEVYLIYIVCSLIALLLSLYFYKKSPVTQLITVGKWQSYYDRIPIDVKAITFSLVGLFTLSLLAYNVSIYLLENIYWFVKDVFINLIFTSLFVGLTVIQGKLLLASIKDMPSLQAEWPKSLTYRVYQGIKEAFLIRSMGTQVLILLLSVFLFGAGAVVVVAEPEFIIIYAPLLLVIGMPIIILTVKGTGYYNRIVSSTGELARGDLGPDLPIVGKSSLAILAHNVNTLKHGVKTSLREQAKSERLKTELITNVSHDLRTPLTSIITYSELLKTQDLTAEDRETYIQIIDRKAKRLKVLIDDLFEVSKMASGSIELVKEKVDLVQLLQQALAEHNEAISQSTLQFRVTTPDNQVYALVDGQKMWRVFDNLIGNILKYTLDNTRVYLSVEALSGRALIVFKNVTKYELGPDIDELFERSKRGDTSRHTEGSGLGLAIAKSIVDLHGGSLIINVDGDLFKITVSLNTTID